jgi:rhodanese-related sulfurtransferase
MSKGLIKKILVFSLCLLSGKGYANDTLTCQEAKAFLKNNINNKEVKIIDVRTPEEFAESRLSKSININWFDKDFDNQIQLLDKKATYIIYCKRGGRSALALKKMHDMGFINVKHIKGGMDEWKRLGYKYE